MAWCPFLRAWHIATRNRQMFGYVFPSDPHTGLKTTLHSSHRGQGFGVAGSSQEPTYTTRRELLAFLGSEHLAVASWQLFMYVFLSEPQTGRFFEGHFLGHGFKLDAGFPHAPETNWERFELSAYTLSDFRYWHSTQQSKEKQKILLVGSVLSPEQCDKGYSLTWKQRRSKLKDPVLTSRHCARVFVLFTRARQPLFLRSSAWKGIFVVHRCFRRVIFWGENLWHGKV